jgi:adenine-specific DNA-methyltransferase
LAKELLTDPGSIFVQISDENIHHVRELMDEVFGAQQFCSLITFAKTSAQTDDLLPNIADYVLWFAKVKERTKFRQLFVEKEVGLLVPSLLVVPSRGRTGSNCQG